MKKILLFLISSSLSGATADTSQEIGEINYNCNLGDINSCNYNCNLGDINSCNRLISYANQGNSQAKILVQQNTGQFRAQLQQCNQQLQQLNPKVQAVNAVSSSVSDLRKAVTTCQEGITQQDGGYYEENTFISDF